MLKSITVNEDGGYDFPVPKCRNGIVLIIDALGIRGLSCEECQQFYVDRSISHIKSFQWGYNNLSFRKKYRDELGDVEIFSIGDTIIFAWETPEPSEEYFNYFPAVLGFTFRLIPHGFEQNIRYRGAISFGEFLANTDDNTILGPAVSDAASYYEAAQWMGIIGTPNFGSELERHPGVKNDPRIIESLAIKYPVELKDKNGNLNVMNLWSINWPQYYMMMSMANYRDRFYSDFEKFDYSPKDKSKYDSTRQFFDHCCELIEKSTKDGANQPKLSDPEYGQKLLDFVNKRISEWENGEG